MLIRSFLLLIFLFQCSLSPIVASDNIHLKSLLAKNHSKAKSLKNDLLEEEDDEEESNDGQSIDINIPDYVLKIPTCKEIATSRPQELYSFQYTYSKIPILIWVQNFRI